MLKYWLAFLSICESIGRARAATALARSGRHDLAKQLMSKNDDKF